MTPSDVQRPIWDRGDPIDAQMLAFTTGDDPLMDRRLVEHDIRGSLAHAAGLALNCFIRLSVTWTGGVFFRAAALTRESRSAAPIGTRTGSLFLLCCLQILIERHQQVLRAT